MTEPIQYIGEHLWPGYVGQPALLLLFCAALLGSFSYIMATRHRNQEAVAGNWLRLGRVSFAIHGISVFVVIGILFFIMINRYYEYQYVQSHVNDELQFRYIFSAFWEGQEGSFLLWMFWHVILGLLLLLSARDWEAPVMAVLTSAQVIIGSMLLGVYIGWGDDPFRLGSNPMLLLRDTMDIPLFANADYVSLLEGTGLNPLLQNYWMTIHPPTLFLGFASTIVPFAFAVGGLWTRRHREWLQPALPWALFSGAILGTGILMGGAWAYEALSFGGYWAWDPVENMSLVPWLTLVAGIHTHLVAKNTDHSIRFTYIYYALTFVLIIYSTFLTRSGVLGETSVHAFTEMGLETQLIAFILVYLLLSLWLIASRWKDVPAPPKEEPTASKEFWMFIGSLVLLFSAVLITGSTSLPVYNKIRSFFEPGFLGTVILDPVPHYNKYQLWIGIFIGLLSGAAQFLRFREQHFANVRQRYLLHVGISIVLAAAATWGAAQLINISAWQYQLLMFSGLFTVFTNLDYIFSFLKGNLKAGGSAIAHIGFGLMVAGILFSGLNQKVISRNPFLMDGLTESEEANRNTVVLIQGSPMVMGDYELMLKADTLDHLTRTYFIDYKRRDAAGNIVESFTLQPNVLYDKTFSKIAAANPSTKHYWNRDIFTYIPALPPDEIDLNAKRTKDDSLNYRRLDLPVGETFTLLDTVRLEDRDTFAVREYHVKVLSIERYAQHREYDREEGDMSVGVKMSITAPHLDDSSFVVMPVLALRGQALYRFPEQINPINARVRLVPEVFDVVFRDERELNYQSFELAQGETADVGEFQVQFNGFDKDHQSPAYVAQEGDISVAALLTTQTANGVADTLKPMFLIRDKSPFNFKDESFATGIHARLVNINPQTGKASLLLAAEPVRRWVAPVELATQSFRTDWIALQAIEFPGINLFWIGSSLMMIGLTLSMYHRIRTLYVARS
ncbi:MAG: cytochrome c biogenesis protein CcsA [Saprospiraceae bacterium]